MSAETITRIPGVYALSSVRQLAPEAHEGLIYLLQGEDCVLRTAMQELIDRLALKGRVRVVVGGNRISFDHLPLIVGQQAGSIYEIMDQILVSRAETCYQMKDVLGYLESDKTPLVITDLLESFHDEDISVSEVALLLEKCLEQLHALSISAPIFIGTHGNSERLELIELLESNSDERFYFLPPDQLVPDLQPTLFAEI